MNDVSGTSRTGGSVSDIAQLREALDIYEARRAAFEASSYRVSTQRLADAARELLAIREAGALIIVPDENGKWPREVVALVASEMSYPRVASEAHERKAQAVLDALRDVMPPEATK